MSEKERYWSERCLVQLIIVSYSRAMNQTIKADADVRKNTKTALLVIDVQQSFTQRPYFEETDVPLYLRHQNQLIEKAEASGLWLVRVFHVEESGPFSLASKLVQPLKGLRSFEADLTVQKNRHSALANTELAPWLRANGIERLIISGIRSEQCCETTARQASDEGFTVDYVTEATLTFAMSHENGTRYSSAQIKERCELVLAGRFATICSVETALTRAKC
jgi:nicotinamidase-related amidase